MKKNNQTYLIQFKNEKMKSKQEFGLTQQKQSLSLFKTGKKQLVKSNLILKIVYHDQEGDKGSFLRSAHGLTKVL
jgi:hypothetical protein